MKTKFAEIMGYSELDLFNSRKPNMSILRGMYYFWRMEALEISMSELAIMEKRTLYRIKYNINTFLDKMSIKDEFTIEHREKIKDIYPLMTREKSKEVLREYLQTIENEEVEQAIKRLTMK